MQLPKPDQVLCPDKKCPGVLFDTTSKLGAALGVKSVKCDKCGSAFAFDMRETTCN